MTFRFQAMYIKSSNIELCIDVVFINCVEFLVYIDRQVQYRSIIHITSNNEEECFKGLDQIIQKYNSAGFTITIIHAGNEFKLLMDKVKDDLDVTTNYANPGDHVLDIDINNRTSK